MNYNNSSPDHVSVFITFLTCDPQYFQLVSKNSHILLIVLERMSLLLKCKMTMSVQLLLLWCNLLVEASCCRLFVFTVSGFFIICLSAAGNPSQDSVGKWLSTNVTQ